PPSAGPAACTGRGGGDGPPSPAFSPAACRSCRVAPVIAIPGEFAPPTRLLLGPGPSEVHPRVLRAMSASLVGHLDPAFIAMMEEVKALLRFVFADRKSTRLNSSHVA